MINNTTIDYDAIIIGAGPAGSAMAIRLANLGLNTAIIERQQFPRSHVGICLSDQTLPLFNCLGIKNEAFQSAFWQRKITEVKWGDSDTRLVPQTGFHVDRAELDQQLLDLVREAGVTVYQPANIYDLPKFSNSLCRVKIKCNGAQTELSSRFVVNASGRRSAIRGRRIKDSPPLLAIHANWLLSNPPSFDGLIQSGTDAWLWYARTAHNKSLVSVFCDPRRLKSVSNSDLQKIYDHLLEQFPDPSVSRIGVQSSYPQACNASSHHASDLVSDQHIHIGDARISIDPLSSQGVHLAVQSALQAAIVVHTILKKPKNAELAKLFFRNRTSEQVDRYSNKTKSEYARVAATNSNLFWRSRAGRSADIQVNADYAPVAPSVVNPSAQISISPEATIEAGAVIEGMYVEERTILKHPSLECSIAYLNGINLIQLLAKLPKKFTYSNIPILWNDIVSTTNGRKIADWLWTNGILVEAS